MFRKSILVAAMSGCVVTSSFGGFSVTHTRIYVDATLDRIDFYALNTGGDTGTGLLAVEFFSAATNGEAVWRSTSAGNWNPLNSADTANRSWVRVDPEDVSSSSLVNKTPSANQPLAPQYGASTVALGNFGVVVAGLAGAVPPQSPAGNHFASLYVSKSYSATWSGNVGGSAGSKVPFSITVITETPMSLSISPEILNIDVTQPGGDHAGPVLIQAAGNFDGIITSLVRTGSLGALQDNFVEQSFGNETRIVNLSGLNASDIGTYQLTYTATASSGSTRSKVLTINITPEPGMLSVLAASGFVRRRR